MVPNGWEKTTVGAACAIKNNLRFPINTEQRQSMAGVYPYFGPTGVLSHIDHYRIDEEFAVIGEDGDHFLKFRSKPMTLHFEGKANVNNHAHVIADSEKCSPKWFYYWFMHRDLAPALSRQGVGRYKLTKKGLEGLEILIPPKNEQLHISRILSTWDKAIFNLERTIINSNKQKKALIHSLLSDRPRKKMGKKVLHREHAASIFFPRSTRNNNELELLSVMQDVGVVPRSSLDRKVVMPEGSTSGYKLVEAGDFVISLRSFEGGLEYSEYKGLVSPAYTVLSSKRPIVNDFYRHYFKSADFIGRLAVAVIGIRDGKQISYDDFSFLSLPYPSLVEQEEISRLLNNAESIIKKKKNELFLLRQEKIALMNQLLTGKRRVHFPDSETAAQA